MSDNVANVMTEPVLPVRLDRIKATVMVLIAATLWGLSGTASQVLFTHDGVTPGFLVTVRMTVSGLILTFIAQVRHGGARANRIWWTWRSAGSLLIFAIFGLIGVQYSYLAAIAHSNAATATLLQYLGPVVIVLYLAARNRRMPRWAEQIAVVLAIFGTFLLVTNGDWRGLTISQSGLVWGLASAFALAFYTVYPKSLLNRYGSATVIGWAMTLGGLILCALVRPWRTVPHHLSLSAWFLIAFVTLGGTLIAFYLYLGSLRWLSASETSLLACAEPLSAALAALLLLHVSMGIASLAGGACIVATIFILARATRQTG